MPEAFDLPIPPDSTVTEYQVLYRLRDDDMWTGSPRSDSLEWIEDRRDAYRRRLPDADIVIIERTVSVKIRVIDPEETL